MTSGRRIACALMIAAAIVAGVAGCGAKQVAKTMIEQGIEPTSTGPHNVAPANNAQNAVDSLNNSTKQTQQNVDSLGQ
jgi:hypothetical protein